MSHKATHWLEELAPRDVTHGAFRVLFHLCCAHNSHKGKDVACYPSQARLMKQSGLSNGGLNKCLNNLEAWGFIRRLRTRNSDGTKGRTYYLLGFDLTGWGDSTGIRPSPPLSGDGTSSTPEALPPPLLEGVGTPPSGDKPVTKEPVKEAVRKKRASLFAENWVPDEKTITGCRQMGFDHLQIDLMVQDCVNYHRSKGTTFVRHNAAFRNWASNQIRFYGSPEEQRNKGHKNAQFDTAHREYARRRSSGEIKGGTDPSDPFAG